jgi:hypothetical protein
MTRVKALYRSWAIPCVGKQVYAPRHRAEWLAKISEPGVCRRAEFYYQQLDALRSLRREVRRELLEESKKHRAWPLLCEIPSMGPIRARPSRTTRKSYRPRVSDRTMVGTDHRFCFAGFRTDWLRREQSMKTASRRNPNRLRRTAQHPSPWRGSLEKISLDHVGWEVRKTLAAAIVFLLDFPLYRTSRDLTSLWKN